jgi:hypothetical protein
VLHAGSAQEKSEPQYVIVFAPSKQYAAPKEPQVPHCVAGHAGGMPLQSFFAFFFLHLSTEADAGRLVSTGAAHATAPAIPMLRSTSRREIRFSSKELTPLPLDENWISEGYPCGPRRASPSRVNLPVVGA